MRWHWPRPARLPSPLTPVPQADTPRCRQRDAPHGVLSTGVCQPHQQHGTVHIAGRCAPCCADRHSMHCSQRHTRRAQGGDERKSSCGYRSACVCTAPPLPGRFLFWAGAARSPVGPSLGGCVLESIGKQTSWPQKPVQISIAGKSQRGREGGEEEERQQQFVHEGIHVRRQETQGTVQHQGG